MGSEMVAGLRIILLTTHVSHWYSRVTRTNRIFFSPLAIEIVGRKICVINDDEYELKIEKQVEIWAISF